MSSDPERVQAIFGEAVQKPESERAGFLERACGGDSELQRRVEALVAAHEHSGSFLDSPPKDLAGTNPTIAHSMPEQVGSLIGHFKLLQQIGEGGMGAVYMAEQIEPVERRVALKIIKPGMDTKAVIARFEAERQALAMMDHPGIAKVLDVGTTNFGRPYFVMELVRGVPITQYCDEHQLTPRQRLELFLPVCQAVQHAHQKGIIHRDIKPSNVLVAEYDDRPVPKIIDFGLAKAMEKRLTPKTMFTEFGQIVGTPDYMSPEQAKLNQMDIDTRSDIYSLGVLLYELLSGNTPFDRQRMRSAAFDELLRIIREEEPPKPSQRLSTVDTLPSIAANRHITPAELTRQLSGELDWIVMKTLEKDRSRRYDTANGLANDIRCYLDDQPVQACPPSSGYRFRKFASRNKAVIGTTAAIAATLITGIIATSWQAYEAGNERDRAVVAEGNAVKEAKRAMKAEQLAEERLVTVSRQKEEIAEEKRNKEEQAEITQAVSDFLQKDLLGMANPARQVENEIDPDPNIKLLTLLDRAATTIEGRFHDRPLIEAAIRSTLGDAYSAIGRYQEAEEQHRRSLELRKLELGPEHRDTLAIMNDLANSFREQGQYEAATKLHREALETQQRVLGPEHPDTLISMNNLGALLNAQGQYEDAEKLHRETLEIRQRVLGPENPDTLISMNDLANSLSRQGEHEAAEKLHRATLEIQQRVLRSEHPDSLISMNNLAITLHRAGQPKAAEKLHRETLEIQQRVLGPAHPNTLYSNYKLATSLNGQRRFEAAEKLYRETLALSQRVLGPEHPDTLHCMINLATSLSRQGEHEAAEKLCREILEIRRRVLGPEHPKTLSSMNNLANTLRDQGQSKAAEKLHRETLEIRQRVLGLEHRDTLISMINVAKSLYRQGEHKGAEKLHRETLEIQRRVLGPKHPDTLASINHLLATCTILTWHLATAYDVTQRNAAEAVRLGTLACELQPDSANNWNNLGVAQYRAGDFDAALEALLKADAMIESGDRVHRMFLAMTLHQLGRTDEAIRRYVEGAAWIAVWRTNSKEQILFRAEAEELLGIDAKRRDALIAEYYSAPSPTNATLSYWQDRGRWHLERSEYEQSVNDLTHAIQLDAENADSYERRGAALVKLKRWDEALRDCNDAIRISPEKYWAYLNRSRAHEGLELPEAALSDAEKAAALGPSDKWAWRNLAEIGERQQQWKRAAAGYGNFLSFQPDDSRYWIPYANALLASDQLDEYRTFCTELVERNADTEDPQKARLIIFCLNKAPDVVEDWTTPIRLAELVLASEKPSANHVSLLFVRAGQYRRAIELQENAIQAAQRDLNAWDCLRMGLAYHGLGEFEKAQRSLAQADKLTAENKPLTEASDYQRLHREVTLLLAPETVPPNE